MESYYSLLVTVIEEVHPCRPVFQWDGKTSYGIDNGELVPADRHANERTGRGIGWVAANGDRPLRTRAVYGKSSQRIGASGEEPFAQRNIAAGKRRCKTDAKIVCIGQPRAKRQIEGGLPQETGEVAAGAEGGGRDAESKCLIETVMGVERLIARVTDVLGGKCGEAHALVLRQDQFWNSDVTEVGVLEAVTDAEGLGALRIQS